MSRRLPSASKDSFVNPSRASVQDRTSAPAMKRNVASWSMAELYDPYSHELHEDPYPVYRALRDEHPLYYCEARGVWALSRFDDVWDAVHDPVTFCSGQGVFPGMGEYNPDQMLPV